MLHLEIILIALIITIVVDLTDFIDSLKTGLNKLLLPKLNLTTLKIPLLECSLCLTFWTSIIYTLIFYQLNIYLIAYILIVSFNTDIIRDIIIKLKDRIILLINKL